MSSVVISGDSSGTVSLTVPSVAGTNTATLPAATGTVMVSGNMPAFSAYNAGSVTIGTATWTKVVLNSEYFDTANCFDSTTNYRFTPTVAGYYQISGSIYFGSGSGQSICALYKNSNLYASYGRNSAYPTQLSGSVLVYANGTTDYFELYAFSNNGTGSIGNDAALVYMTGSLVRAA